MTGLIWIQIFTTGLRRYALFRYELPVVKTFINGFRYEYPEFQSNEWKSNPNSRWDMAPGIINRGDLKNKCKTEIERNLGLPDENFENVWTYELGFGNLVINYYNDCFKNAYIACR